MVLNEICVIPYAQLERVSSGVDICHFRYDSEDTHRLRLRYNLQIKYAILEEE
jgi:hypothetical protein